MAALPAHWRDTIRNRPTSESESIMMSSTRPADPGTVSLSSQVPVPRHSLSVNRFLFHPGGFFITAPPPTVHVATRDLRVGAAPLCVRLRAWPGFTARFTVSSRQWVC